MGSVVTQPLYPRGKSHRYSKNYTLDGPHSRSGRFFVLAGNRTMMSQEPSLQQVAIPTEPDSLQLGDRRLLLSYILHNLKLLFFREVVLT
jgi:hypothetical protein